MNEQELLKKSTAAQKENNVDLAIQYIDEAINSYLAKGELGNAFPAYKKKASYLLKDGRGNESWTLYKDLINKYANDHIFLPQVYFEMSKQLKQEKKFKDALATAIYSEILRTRSQLIQNHQYQDNTFKIDYNWNNDKIFRDLSKKAGIDWEPIKEALIDMHRDINHKSDFNNIYLKIREVIKNL